MSGTTSENTKPNSQNEDTMRVFLSWSEADKSEQRAFAALQERGRLLKQINEMLQPVLAQDQNIEEKREDGTQQTSVTISFDVAAASEWDRLSNLSGPLPSALLVENVTSDVDAPSVQSAEAMKNTPPTGAEYMLYLLLPKATRQIITGDFNEEYGGIFAKFGKRRADVWYWKNVLCSFGPLLFQCITRLIQLHRWMAK